MGESCGAPLLAAATADALHERLDAAVEDASLHRLIRAMQDACLPLDAPLPVLDKTATEARLRSILSEAVVPLFWHAIETSVQIVHYRKELLRQAPDVVAAAAAACAAAAEPLWFVTDVSVSPLIAQRLLGGLRADVASLAAAWALAQGHRLPTWLAAELGTVCLQGTRGFLALMASHPAYGIPVDVVPVEERLDLAALDRRQALAELGYALLVAEATHRGGLVYAPFQDDHDGEDAV